MEIKFNTGSISQVEYATSTIDKFNGVDKTTTPTEMDNSRAVEMSNYLPEGNSLVKRYGIKKINSEIFTYLYNQGATNLKLLDFWSYDVGKVYYFKLNKSITDNGVTTTYNHCLIYNKIDTYTVKWLSTDKDDYSSAIQYENKFFVLCNCGYFMLDDNGFVSLLDYNSNSISFDTYIPTRYIIPTYNNSSEKDTNTITLENLNLTTNKFSVKTLPLIQTKLNFTSHYFSSVNVISPSQNWGVIYLELDGYVDLSDYLEYKPALPLSYALLDLSEYSDIIQYGYDKIQIPMSYDSDKKMYRIKATFDSSAIGGDGDCDIWFKSVAEIEKNISIVEKALKTKELRLYFVDESINTKVSDFKHFKPFGTDGYTDRLFLFGNPNYPNLDIHSGYASQSNERWKDYAYFPDSSYQTLGSSDSAITGYGILSNGVMAIFKQSKDNEPNLYFRRAVNTTTLSSDEVVTSSMYGYDEYYPITRSGVNIGSDYFEQVIQFGNDLLINTPNGLFRIDVGTSTATQTYLAKEVSYFLRNEWSTDMTGSIHCVFGNKLFIKRKNKDGIYRIYVADMNRYSFNDSIQQYEWWILDDINVDKFKVVDNQLYMINDNGVYVFNEGSFVDEDYVELNTVQVSGTTINDELFYDSDTDRFIMSSTSHYMEEISNSNNKYEKYQELKDNLDIKINDNHFILDLGVKFKIVEELEGYIENSISHPHYLIKLTDCDEVMDFLMNLFQDIGLSDSGFSFVSDSVLYVPLDTYYNYDSNNNKELYIEVALIFSGDTLTDNSELYLSDFISSSMLIYDENTDLNAGLYIKELYNSDNIPLSHITASDNIFIDTYNGNYNVLNNTVFNEIEYGISYKKDYKFPVKMVWTDNDNLISKVILYKKTPVKSYWYSKFNDCGHIEYLKTANYLYFVPETRRGGKTHIGYRTSKKEVGYDTRYFTRQLDFNNIDFDEFSFGELEFGHSISSKKKIKNFSFVQLVAYSNESVDSTLAQLTFRYRYTKNNKGVK